MKKPTYEELEKENIELKQEIIKLNKLIEKNKERYNNFVNSFNISIDESK